MRVWCGVCGCGVWVWSVWVWCEGDECVGVECEGGDEGMGVRVMIIECVSVKVYGQV